MLLLTANIHCVDCMPSHSCLTGSNNKTSLCMAVWQLCPDPVSLTPVHVLLLSTCHAPVQLTGQGVVLLQT